MTADPPARRVEHVMGMPISLALRGRHATGPAADAAWADVLASLRETDGVFSPYRPDSAVSRIACGELAPEQAPTEVAEVAGIAARAERASGGAFSAWRADPDGTTRFDPTGVVKGWAVDRAAAPLRTLPDTDFCLGAGGDLLCCAEHGDPWRVGIEDPSDPGRLLAVVGVRDGAVATSGTAHRGAHLVDARTGRAPTDVAQVTVVVPRTAVVDALTWADVDATAAYAHGAGAADWLGGRVGRTGLVVWADGTTTTIG